MDQPVDKRGPGIYGRMLEVPVPVVLAVLWLLGMVLFGACGLTLYWLVRTLVGA